jgi:hypothetical protein
MSLVAPVTIVALLLPTCSSVLAQPGIHVGVSAATLAIAEDEGRPFFGREIEWLIWGKETGLHVGVFHRIHLSRHLGLLTELSYVRRGLKGDTRLLFDDIDYGIALDYLEVPLAATITLPIGKTFAAHLVGGAYGALQIGARRSSRIDGITERVDLSNARRWDYGLMTGIAPSVSMRGRIIRIELRYYYGLANIMESMRGSVPVSAEGGSVKNRSFSVLLGVSL